MTDRIRTLTVVLDRDYRTDDVEEIINAVQYIKGVMLVEKGQPVNMNDFTNRSLMGMTYRKALWQAIQDVEDGKVQL